MDEESIHDNLSKRLKQSFDCFYHYQDRDLEKFHSQGLAPDFFHMQPGQTFSREVALLRNELAIPCQARNP